MDNVTEKYYKIKSQAYCGKYETTFNKIVEYIPCHIWETCSIKDLALLCDRMYDLMYRS